MEPQASRCPFAFCSRRRNLYRRGRLLDRKAPEKTQLDNPGLAGIQLGQLIQGVVQSYEINACRFFRTCDVGFVQGDSYGAAPSFGSNCFPSVVNQNLPHHLGSHRKKVYSIVKVR